MCYCGGEFFIRSDCNFSRFFFLGKERGRKKRVLQYYSFILIEKYIWKKCVSSVKN